MLNKDNKRLLNMIVSQQFPDTDMGRILKMDMLQKDRVFRLSYQSARCTPNYIKYYKQPIHSTWLNVPHDISETVYFHLYPNHDTARLKVYV